MDNHKLYECVNGKVYKLPPNHCVFCEHCADLIYDYTNGPYCFFCDLSNETDCYEYETCGHFKDNGYKFDEKDYLERIGKQLIAHKQTQDFIKAYPEVFDKIHEELQKYLLGK